MKIARRAALFGASCIAAVVVLPGCASTGDSSGTSDDPIVFGVSGPLSGNSAQYGKDWQKGFDLFLDQINGAGGIKGRKVKIDFQDSRNDPSQATTIAQKFVSDKSISAVMGDFSSATSTVASPIYQRSALLQLGITNSAPTFTKTGDYIFSPAVTQETDARDLEHVATSHGDKIALVYLNTDWGKSAADIFEDEAKKKGQQIAVKVGVEEASTDFKPVLLKIKDSGANVVSSLTYYNTTALLVQQASQVGLTGVPFVVNGSNYSPQFLKLAGAAANGTYTTTTFFPGESRSEVVTFVDAFKKKYGTEPNLFNAFAYDGMQQLAWAVEHSDGTRTGIRNALRDGKNIPSVVFGPFSYNSDRRIDNPTITPLIVKDGAFVKVGS